MQRSFYSPDRNVNNLATFCNFWNKLHIYSPIIILLNLFNYVCGQFMSETIYSKRFGFPIWLLQSQLPFQRWRSTFISSCETDSLYIAFASFSSLSCCFYERFFAIDWLFVHLCMHKINLLPCVSMALAKEGSPTIILIKSCGGHFLWKRVWDLSWSGLVGQFWAHKWCNLGAS